MIKRFSAPKNEGCNIFSMFSYVFSFLTKKLFDMCFDNLIKIYVSHHYYITQAI